MLGKIGKLSGAVGRMASPSSRSAKYVTGAGLTGAARQARQTKYGIAGKGASSKTATRAFQSAVAQRQAQVGNRIIAGTGLATGAAALGRDTNTSAYNPMPAPRGTGRYA
jgi:hypothetical protein